MTDSNTALQEYVSTLGFTLGDSLSTGHTTALLYKMTDASNREYVLKIGSPSGDSSEIVANQRGYDALKKLSATSILPPNLSYGTFENRQYIIMPYLGLDITKQDSQGTLSPETYELFSRQIIQLITETVVTTGLSLHKKGLDMLCNDIQAWLQKIADSYNIPKEKIELVSRIDTACISSQKACIMIQDFTPDNTFIYDNRVSFIDPWEQTTYQGSLIPSLAQFLTLAIEVYKLPAAIHAASRLYSIIEEIGTLLGLSKEQQYAQQFLGSTLQYLLSGHARLEKEPATAAKYINKALDLLAEVHSIVLVIKQRSIK